MSHWTIYHNPRCSKSRQTLAILESHGIEPQIVEYLKNPPIKSELETIIARLDQPARTIIRTKEDEFDKDTMDLDDEASIIAAIIEHPKLLERPIVIHGDKAVVGRPPENVLSLL